MSQNNKQTNPSNEVAATAPEDAAEDYGHSDVLTVDRNSPEQQELAKLIGWDGIQALSRQQARAAAKMVD